MHIQSLGTIKRGYTGRVSFKTYVIIMESIKSTFKKYAVFTGRATRKEFWYFALFVIITSAVLSTIENGLGLFPAFDGGRGRGAEDESLLASIFTLIILVPYFAVGIRRMHDVDHKGWWILVPLYNLYLFCVPGTPGSNRFGANPRGEVMTTAADATVASAAPAATSEASEV